MSEYRVDELTIQPFDVEKDAEVLRRIVAEVFGGGFGALMEQEFGVIGGRPWGEWQADNILAYFAPDETRSFVVRKDDEIVGFCSYVIDPARKCGQVGYNAVAREHQGKGIGSAMMKFVMDRFQAEGMEYAMVLVSDNAEHAPALRVYEKFGFQRITGYHEMLQKLPLGGDQGQA